MLTRWPKQEVRAQVEGMTLLGSPHFEVRRTPAISALWDIQLSLCCILYEVSGFNSYSSLLVYCLFVRFESHRSS
jgi:hypothetical protein